MEDTLMEELERYPLTDKEVGDPSNAFTFSEGNEGEGINGHWALVIN